MWSSWALWHQDPLASGLIGLERPSVRGAIRTKLCNKHKTLRYGQNFEERAKLWNTDKTLQYRHNCAIRTQFCICHHRQEMCKYMSVCVVSMSWVWVKVCMNVCMLWQAVVWVCVCMRICVKLLLWYSVGRLDVIGTGDVYVYEYVLMFVYVCVYISMCTYKYVSLFVYAIAMASCGTVGCNRRHEMDNWSNSWGQTYLDLSISNHHQHYKW